MLRGARRRSGGGTIDSWARWKEPPFYRLSAACKAHLRSSHEQVAPKSEAAAWRRGGCRLHCTHAARPRHRACRRACQPRCLVPPCPCPCSRPGGGGPASPAGHLRAAAPGLQPRGSGGHARPRRLPLARCTHRRRRARGHPPESSARHSGGPERERGAGRTALYRRAQPGVPFLPGHGVCRHADARRHPAQHPRKSRLVHGLHALSGRDRPGAPGGADQLPDDGLRPDRHGHRQRLAARRGHRRRRGHGAGLRRQGQAGRNGNRFSSRLFVIRRRLPSSRPARNRSSIKVVVGDHASAAHRRHVLRRAGPVPGDGRQHL